MDLEEPVLSNREQLELLFDAYLKERQPEIVDRLRGYYFAKFQVGENLDEYVERKKLSFIEFNDDWVIAHETLEKDVVDGYISSFLEKFFDQEESVSLKPLKQVLAANRNAVRDFVAKATPIVGAWCKREKMDVPEIWVNINEQDIARQLENKGHFDFEFLELDRFPAICSDASCWPRSYAANN